MTIGGQYVKTKPFASRADAEAYAKLECLKREKLPDGLQDWLDTDTPQIGKPEDTMTAEDRKEQLEPDYEPEQAYGTAEDFRRHHQYGGTRDDY